MIVKHSMHFVGMLELVIVQLSKPTSLPENRSLMATEELASKFPIAISWN
jgi:hypothetical protein